MHNALLGAVQSEDDCLGDSDDDGDMIVMVIVMVVMVINDDSRD